VGIQHRFHEIRLDKGGKRVEAFDSYSLFDRHPRKSLQFAATGVDA
jgi:hypothetical protein